MTNYHLTLKSSNAKTGPIPVSTTSADTCPNVCPFRKSGCYADSGPLALHWAKVTHGERGASFSALLSCIKAFPDDQLWRHNQAGDLPGYADKLDIVALRKLVAANRGKRGFTYTHKPLRTTGERQAIHDANAQGFTVNLSANSLEHADELANLKIGPVVVVLPIAQSNNTSTPQGRKVVVCPATIRDDVSCATCQLCQRQREVIVGFPAHGTGARKAQAVTLHYQPRS